jgi:hypothetical protein
MIEDENLCRAFIHLASTTFVGYLLRLRQSAGTPGVRMRSLSTSFR